MFFLQWVCAVSMAHMSTVYVIDNTSESYFYRLVSLYVFLRLEGFAAGVRPLHEAQRSATAQRAGDSRLFGWQPGMWWRQNQLCVDSGQEERGHLRLTGLPLRRQGGLIRCGFTATKLYEGREGPLVHASNITRS